RLRWRRRSGRRRKLILRTHQHDYVIVVIGYVRAVDVYAGARCPDVAAFEHCTPLAVDIPPHSDETFVCELGICEGTVGAVNKSETGTGPDIGRQPVRGKEIVQHLAHELDLPPGDVELPHWQVSRDGNLTVANLQFHAWANEIISRDKRAKAKTD